MADGYVFTNVNEITLHVPIGTAERYRNAAVWKNFGNIVEYELSGISTVECEKSTVERGKFIENGKVVIIIASKKYTVAGQEIR